MAREEIAGYMILAALAVMLIGAIRAFGFTRVMAALAGTMLLVVATTFRSVRTSSRRRY